MHPASTILGAILWIAFVVILPIDADPVSYITPLLLLALLVLIPLVLGIPDRHEQSKPFFQVDSSTFESSDQDDPSDHESISDNGQPPTAPPQHLTSTGLRRFARTLHPFAAVSAALSFLLEPGIWAGVFCGFWLLFSLTLAAHSIYRIVERKGVGPLEELAVDIGKLYLPIGALWLLASRLGLAVMGFGGVIALLTAVHFHYAGFLASTLAGLAGRQMSEAPTRTLYRLTTPAVLAGPILVAVGIVLSSQQVMAASIVEVAAATLLATGVALLAASVIVGVVPRLSSISSQILLTLWGLSSTVAMVLAVLYALAMATEAEFMNIPRMVILHGTLNAGGALVGLLGWRLLYRDATSSGGDHEST